MLTLFSIVFAVYAYYSYVNEKVSIRGVTFYLDTQPLLYWPILIFLLGLSLYLLYIAWVKDDCSE